MSTPSTIEARAAEWLRSGKTGTSSKTMHAFFTTGGAYLPSYPSDSDDFGRCMGLLAAVPEWRARLPELAGVDSGLCGQVWAKLAGLWESLEAVYQEDKALCSRMMKSAIEPLEQASGQVAKIGPNAKIIIPAQPSAFQEAVIKHAEKHGGKAAGVRTKHAAQDANKAVAGIKAALEGGAGIGHNSGMDSNTASTKKFPTGEAADVDGVAGRRLLSIIERVERMEEEKAAMAEDIKEIYGEAKATGFDVKTIRKIVRLRKMETEKRREEEDILEVYKAAIGME